MSITWLGNLTISCLEQPSPPPTTQTCSSSGPLQLILSSSSPLPGAIVVLWLSILSPRCPAHLQLNWSFVDSLSVLDILRCLAPHCPTDLPSSTSPLWTLLQNSTGSSIPDPPCCSPSSLFQNSMGSSIPDPPCCGPSSLTLKLFLPIPSSIHSVTQNPHLLFMSPTRP